MTTFDKVERVIWTRSFKCDHCKKRHTVEGIRPELDKLQEKRTQKCKEDEK